MPKTSKARRQRRLKRDPLRFADGNSVQGTGKASQPRTERAPTHSFLSPSVRGPESLIFPAMVALGCWGIVIYFLFLTGEANHILFGGMAVLMALLWTFSFGTRVRKLLQQRSRM